MYLVANMEGIVGIVLGTHMLQNVYLSEAKSSMVLQVYYKMINILLLTNYIHIIFLMFRGLLQTIFESTLIINLCNIDSGSYEYMVHCHSQL